MVERRVSIEVVSSGSMIAATAGFAAIVLGILSLLDLTPLYLVSIATLVIGVALMFEGGAVAARYWKLPEEIAKGPWSSFELASGMIVEILAGAAGLTLGILAIIGFIPLLLVTISVLIFGGALILGSGLTSRLNHIEYGSETEESKRVYYRGNWFTNWLTVATQFLSGAAAIVLGILAAVGIVPLTLMAVSMLVLGFAALLFGSTVTNRTMHLLHRC
jgi:hypothetical protein